MLPTSWRSALWGGNLRRRSNASGLFYVNKADTAILVVKTLHCVFFSSLKQSLNHEPIRWESLGWVMVYFYLTETNGLGTDGCSHLHFTSTSWNPTWTSTTTHVTLFLYVAHLLHHMAKWVIKVLESIVLFPYCSQIPPISRYDEKFFLYIYGEIHMAKWWYFRIIG